MTTAEEDFGELGRVDKFVYLGHFLDASGGFEEAVNHRVQSAWFAFRRLRGTLVGKHGLSLRQRGFIYSRCVRSVLLHSSETWCLTTSLKQRLQSTERRMVIMMCGVRLVDPLPSEELRVVYKSVVEITRGLKCTFLTPLGLTYRPYSDNGRLVYYYYCHGIDTLELKLNYKY